MEPLRIETNERNFLSPRETQILLFLAQCKSMKEISKTLFISIQTAHTHKRRMMEKMGFRNNLEIIRYAVENNLDKKDLTLIKQLNN